MLKTLQPGSFLAKNVDPLSRQLRNPLTRREFFIELLLSLKLRLSTTRLKSKDLLNNGIIPFTLRQKFKTTISARTVMAYVF